MSICYTTYIYGDRYQDFIPLILYSVYRSNPNAHVMLFLNSKIRGDLHAPIELITPYYKNFDIIENTFDDCPKMNAVKAQSLRWVLWNEKFLDFDYLYYIDSDILFIEEAPNLVEQHIRHMKYIKSDYCSNILRQRSLKNTDIVQLYNSYRYGGLKNVFTYLFTSSALRMSGLHFVKTKEYFNYITKDIIEKYRKQIYSGGVFVKLGWPDNEYMLYSMMKEAGCDMTCFAIQKTSTSMFGFDNPEKSEFCPHHGLHLGIFRRDIDQLAEFAKAQLESGDYQYYITQFVEHYYNDDLFIKIFNCLSPDLKHKFAEMYKYYNIGNSENS
jgi:hypothetical protein